MHQSLRVPEITALIVEACVPTYKERGPERLRKVDRRTLCVLARTCRELQEPALDILWCYQEGLDNLLSLLPAKFWEPVKKEVHGNVWEDVYFLRGVAGRYLEMRIASADRRNGQEPSSLDFERFNFYAPRVHKLLHKWHAGYRRFKEIRRHKEISADVYNQLCTLNGGGPLLPNLQTIIWRPALEISEHWIDLMRCYASPNLLSLELYSPLPELQGTPDAFLGALASLPSSCPNLQHLALSLRAGPPLSMLPSIISNWTSIRSVNLRLTMSGRDQNSVVPLLLTTLAPISNLQKLSLISKDSSYKDPEEWSDHMTIFPTTEALSIEADDPRFANTLLKFISLPQLRQLDILSNSTMMRDFPSRLQHTVSSDALQRLVIRSTIDLRGWPENPVIGFEELTPLVEYHNLRHLVIQLKYPALGFMANADHVFGPQMGISLTDADWEIMAQAWPRLQTLHVVGARQTEVARGFIGPTYRAFASLVRHCPSLEDIGLFISESVGTEDDLEELPVHKRPVNLRFYHSKIEQEHYAFTALWIQRMFPYVKHILRWDIVARHPENRNSVQDEELPWVAMMKLTSVDSMKPMTTYFEEEIRIPGRSYTVGQDNAAQVEGMPYAMFALSSPRTQR